jgi:hypothetical protein
VAGPTGVEGTVFAVPPEPLQPAIAMNDARTAPAATDDRAMSVRWQMYTSVSCDNGGYRIILRQTGPGAAWGDTLPFLNARERQAKRVTTRDAALEYHPVGQTPVLRPGIDARPEFWDTLRAYARATFSGLLGRSFPPG